MSGVASQKDPSVAPLLTDSAFEGVDRMTNNLSIARLDSPPTQMLSGRRFTLQVLASFTFERIHFKP